MGRIIKSHDDLPTREYIEFLQQFNGLRDCSWYWEDNHDSRDRFKNWELSKLRNEKGGVFEVEGDGNDAYFLKRNHFTLSQTRLAAHRREKRKRKAVWMTNESNADVILMLLDLDKKTLDTDCTAAARHFIRKYLGGQGYVEMSTGGRGLHVYFFVNLKYVKRKSFNEALKSFYDVLDADPFFASVGQPFDAVPIYGIPTLWSKDCFGQYKVEYRGNQLKVPYLPNGWRDLDALRLLSQSPLTGQKLVDWCRMKKVKPSPSCRLPSSCNSQVAQKRKPHGAAPTGGSGQQRRAKLYAKMKGENPNLTEDDFVAAYEIRTPENGGEEKVRDDFRRMERTFIVARKKPAIDMSKYFDLVKHVIPPLAMTTEKGRTKLTHERVAQFVSVKMYDAQRVGEYQAVASRDATLTLWASLKEQGMIDWSMTKNTHSKLIRLCTDYKLLDVIERQTAPSYPGAGDGRARRIGPGEALGEEYERYRFTRRRLQSEAAKLAKTKLAI